jgi:phage terminase large subunit-like protein
MTKTDPTTQLWMRNRSDDLAVENGCWFDVEVGAYVVWWIERYCKLYEGEWAGEPVLLRSGNPEVDQRIELEWDEGGREASIKRAEIYAEWIASGEAQPDWQYECTMRMFGWQRFSQRWQRAVRRFNQAVVFIPKKQKKSPTLAAWGVYLTCGDGEQGGNTSCGAKDGNQAGISMRHALLMVEQSQELREVCKINQNEKSIEHLPSRSKYKPLSSANERTQKSKEGINGNILIDELHVCDRALIEIISRAGISRAEPMHIEVSTAGNNPDGYGFERQTYARAVLSGAEHNDQMFVAIYEAPQNLTDEELAKDPIKYGKMANPAWGHTAHEEEYLADYNQSRQSLRSLAIFKMYRLNIWQHTASQWLQMDKWVSCAERLNLEDYAGKFAAAGLDLSKTRDMSALAICIPQGGKNLLFPFIWVTEAAIERYRAKVKFEEWIQSGQLFMCEGDTIQEWRIREQFVDIAKLLKLQVLVKDRALAQDFEDWVEDKYPKITQIDYPQNAAMMEKPIDDFEAAVTEGSLTHCNNLCLNWQAGHATVTENGKGCRIIAKPKRDDYRKVDGMVAAVMAMWGTKQLPKQVNGEKYRRRGVLTA